MSDIVGPADSVSQVNAKRDELVELFMNNDGECVYSQPSSFERHTSIELRDNRQSSFFYVNESNLEEARELLTVSGFYVSHFTIVLTSGKKTQLSMVSRDSCSHP